MTRRFLGRTSELIADASERRVIVLWGRNVGLDGLEDLAILQPRSLP